MQWKMMGAGLVALGSVLAVGTTGAEAAQGCGPGFHRGFYGVCRPNPYRPFFRRYGYYRPYGFRPVFYGHRRFYGPRRFHGPRRFGWHGGWHRRGWHRFGWHHGWHRAGWRHGGFGWHHRW